MSFEIEGMGVCLFPQFKHHIHFERFKVCMPYKISEAFNLNRKILIEEGILDAFTDMDSRFYIDPCLLSSTSIPDLSKSYQKLQAHFEKVIRVLDFSQRRQDRFWRQAVKLLCFPEISQLGLGYSKAGKNGSAIGEKLANNLVGTAKEIIDAGIKDPVIFELVGLFEEGIGADRISDMIAFMILSDLLGFTERITKKYLIPSRKIRFSGTAYSLPRDPRSRRALLLVPQEILSPLPVAYSWDDVDYVCSHNQQLRDKVNGIIGYTWKDATNRNQVSKPQLKSILLNEPDVLRDLIKTYKRKVPQKYNFEKDPVGELIWFDISRQFAQGFPLDLDHFGNITADNIFAVVRNICDHYANLIENNGLSKLLYDDDEKLRHERYAQLVFYGIADSYCKANNLDLSRECDAGRGPVDFKISAGYNSKVSVEIKYSTNTRLVTGFTKQLPIYDKAEKTQHSIYLIIQTSDSSRTIQRLKKIRDDASSKFQRVPEIIVANGRLQVSASKKR